MSNIEHLDFETPTFTARELVAPTRKLGRQGYALFLRQITDDAWDWAVESQNGVEVAVSGGVFRKRWDAERSATRLLGTSIKHTYVEDLR